MNDIQGPWGRVIALQYREKTIYQDGGVPSSIDVLRVHLRTHEGENASHDIPNQSWSPNNKALQFLATQGLQPTALDDPYTDIESKDYHVLVPLAVSAEWMDDDWGLAEAAIQEDALDDADWFHPNPFNRDDTDDETEQGGGGGGPDPGTGNRGAVDIEEADDEDDAGVNVSVS